MERKNSGFAKLTKYEVLEIRAAHASGETQTSIAKKFPVTGKTIHRVVRRKSWKHV